MAIADNFDHNSDAGSSAPITRAPPGGNFRFRACSFSWLRWPPWRWKY
jgi:hypothetical protein